MMSMHWALHASDEINENLISHFTYDFAREQLLALILFKKVSGHPRPSLDVEY